MKIVNDSELNIDLINKYKYSINTFITIAQFNKVNIIICSIYHIHINIYTRKYLFLSLNYLRTYNSINLED